MKNALVLSGGGSRGAYEIGVWQALREMGITIDNTLPYFNDVITNPPYGERLEEKSALPALLFFQYLYLALQ